MLKLLQTVFFTLSMLMLSSAADLFAFNSTGSGALGAAGINPAISTANEGLVLLGGFSLLTAILILMAYRSRKPMEVRLMRVVAIILVLISALNVAQGAVN